MKRVAGVAGVLALLALLGVAGAGWYYSGLVIDPSHGDSYPLEVVSYDGTRVTLRGGADTDAPGSFGLTWAAGNAILGDVVARGPGTVTRKVDTVRRGTLRPGVRAYLDRWMWGHEDPRSAVGVPYQEVRIRSELGDFPAWRTEGNGTTWVIAVHGRNANPAEASRVIPVFHRLGMPVLSITYRNDEGAPAGPDGKHHLGASEWKEVAAAIAYARASGATGVYLYGWSMGGAIVPMAARMLPDAPIKGLILDSPVMDWRSPIELGARQRGVPLWLASVGMSVVEWRTGLSFAELDQVAHAADFSVPVLLFVDDDDQTVPVGPAVEFARLRPDIVRLFRTSGAGHTGSWNVSPTAYEKALTDFVTPLP
ncbi:alpha/beta hydrolase [Nonomuraea sp. NPDC003754]